MSKFKTCLLTILIFISFLDCATFQDTVIMGYLICFLFGYSTTYSFFLFQQFLTFLRKQGIKFNKAKVILAKSHKGEQHSHAYVTLRSEEERNSAISKLSGFKYRGCEISVSQGVPLPDPLLMKRKIGEGNGSNDKRSENGTEDGDNDNRRKRARNSEHQNKVSKSTIDDNFEQLPEERRDAIVNAQVASLWDVPYEGQLNTKASLLQKVCFVSIRVFLLTNPLLFFLTFRSYRKTASLNS